MFSPPTPRNGAATILPATVTVPTPVLQQHWQVTQMSLPHAASEKWVVVAFELVALRGLREIVCAWIKDSVVDFQQGHNEDILEGWGQQTNANARTPR